MRKKVFNLRGCWHKDILLKKYILDLGSQTLMLGKVAIKGLG
jgi:hypothetical protein